MTYDREIIENMPPGLRADAIRFGPEEAVRMSALGAPSVVLGTWTLQLVGPPNEVHTWPYLHGGPLLRALRETEENLTDLLPEGYSVRIREWDEEG